MARELSWKTEAACKDLDVDIFFTASEADAGPAKSVCATCPVRQACLDYAIVTRQEDGVWGGMTESERRRERRRRRLGVARPAA